MKSRVFHPSYENGKNRFLRSCCRSRKQKNPVFICMHFHGKETGFFGKTRFLKLSSEIVFWNCLIEDLPGNLQNNPH